MWFDAAHPTPTAVFARSELVAGNVIEGPAIIEQLDTTTLLAPGCRGGVDDMFSIVVEVP